MAAMQTDEAIEMSSRATPRREGKNGSCGGGGGVTGEMQVFMAGQ